MTPPDLIKTSQGCGKLVLEPSHTTSGETSVRTPRIVSERAGSAGFVWLITLLNLGQALTSQQRCNMMRGGAVLGERTSSSTDSARGISGIDAVKDQSDRG